MFIKAKQISLVILVILLGLALASSPAAAKTYRWKMTTSWPAGIPLYTDMAELFAKEVEALSGGHQHGRLSGRRSAFNLVGDATNRADRSVGVDRSSH